MFSMHGTGGGGGGVCVCAPFAWHLSLPDLGEVDLGQWNDLKTKVLANTPRTHQELAGEIRSM